MKRPGTLWRLAGLFGICCSSLCFLALPLLLLWLPASGFGWLHNETLTRSMLLMFLAMFLAGSTSSFRMHRSWPPVLLAFLGASALIATAWHGVRPWAGWLGLATLAATWAYDQHLMRVHHEQEDL